MAKTHYQLSVEHDSGFTSTWTAEGDHKWWGAADMVGQARPEGEEGTYPITGSAEIEAQAGLVYAGDLNLANACIVACHSSASFTTSFEVGSGE